MEIIKMFFKKIIRKIKIRIKYGKEGEPKISLIEFYRQCGAEIGEHVDPFNVLCNGYDATCLKIGNNVTLTGVQILTHDASLVKFIGNDCNKVGRIEIGNDVFVGVGSIILPNVHIGNNVIVGAGSVVTKDIPDNSVAVGNPARVICSCEEYINKHKEAIKNENNVYWDVDRRSMNEEELKKFNQDIDGKIVYLFKSSL